MSLTSFYTEDEPISLSHLREYCYYLVLSSNIRVKGYKMERENNPIRLPLETWCSLTVLQCAASNKGNTCIHQCVLDWVTRVNNIVIKPVIDNRK